MTPAEEDEVLATLTDYVEGTLPADRKKQVEAKIAADPDWKRLHGEMEESTKADAISAVLKARTPAPENFTNNVEKTIHQRSAGRFFARKTFGDRVPFSALLVVAVLLLIVIGYVMWSSQTGSLRVDKKGTGEAPGSAVEVVPKP